MNLPEVKRLGESYSYTWPAPDFAEIEIDQVHHERDAWPSWITIRTRAPGTNPHLAEGSLNLAAISSRNTLARIVAEKAPGVDWAAALEMACVLTVRDQRTGQPFIRVGSLPAETTDPWVLEPVARRGQPTVPFGDGSAVKSTTAAFWSALVSGGVSACGFTPHVTGPVLWLDYETDAGDIDDTYKRIRRGLDVDVDVPDLIYRRESQPLHQAVAQIRRTVDTEGAVMVVIDSIGFAIGDDPKEASAVLRYFAAVRSLGVTSINIDHITLAGNNGKPFGSAYKHNAARLTFEQRKSETPGDTEVHVGLFNRKSNKSRLLPPIGLAVAFTDEAITFRREDVRAPSLVSSLSASQQIKIALQDARRALTMTEIVDLTGLKENVARARTADLVKNKTAVLLPIAGGANKWALASNREDEA